MGGGTNAAIFVEHFFIILIDYWHEYTYYTSRYILLLITMSSLDINMTPIKMSDTSAFMLDPDSDSTDSTASAAAGITTPANAKAKANNNTRNGSRTPSMINEPNHYTSNTTTTTHAPFPKRKKQSILNSCNNAASKQSNSTKASRKIIIQLKALYKQKVKPLEEKYGLYNFCLPTNSELHDSEFDAKPMVLLVGQYSTGKTTFIRHLVGGDYPSMHIGPEPTTDRFTALIHGVDTDNISDGEEEEDEEEMYSQNMDESINTVDDNSTINANTNANANANATMDDNTTSSVKSNPKNILTKRWKKDGVNKSTNGKTVKGNSLTVMPELPFSSLATFGSGFLSHFVGSITDAPLLEHVTLIDTPGVLSGEKQRLSRSYDFAKASRWFADRSDLILLLFDAHKLDISDELKEVIETIRPHNDDKIRCVLNKADGVTREQLVRVYGSLMWSMGKIFNSPEVVRVYTGSVSCI